MIKDKDMIKQHGLHWAWYGLFMIVCFVAGFIVFPAIVLTKTWNYIVIATKTLPTINIFVGVLLWIVIAIILYVTTNKKFRRSYEEGKKKSRNELKKIVTGAKERGIPLSLIKERALKSLKRK